MYSIHLFQLDLNPLLIISAFPITAREFHFKSVILSGYARFAVQGKSFPGIIPVTDAITEGIIYFDVDEPSLKRLDAFEGDLYQRIPIRAETKEKEILNAETYVIKPKFRGYLSSKEWNVKEFAKKYLDTKTDQVYT